MTDFAKQSRPRWFTVSVHTDLISHSATESFYAGDEHFALARFLRKASIVSLLLSGAACWFTVEEDDPHPVAEREHAFVAYPGGRYPNGCVRCGRTREAHVRHATGEEAAAFITEQLESPPTPDTGDDDGTRASEEPDA